ncbi:MAG TPA: hypothetical protein VF595_05640 [Tepidisphaeraceae bacterium]
MSTDRSAFDDSLQRTGFIPPRTRTPFLPNRIDRVDYRRQLGTHLHVVLGEKLKRLLPHLVLPGLVLTHCVHSQTAGAAFLDLTSVVAQNNGSFVGTLDGVPLAGSITTNGAAFSFRAAGGMFDQSTLNNTSPQYSYNRLFSPAQAKTDRIGYEALAGTATSTITLTFGAPVTNPRFHIANLDAASLTFLPGNGLTGLSLVSGNGTGSDGLQVVNNVVSDIDSSPGSGIPPEFEPLNPRGSAYGTVSLNGTFSVFQIIVTPGGSRDGGSFTLSTVPEPQALLLLAGSVAALARRRSVRF